MLCLRTRGVVQRGRHPGCRWAGPGTEGGAEGVEELLELLDGYVPAGAGDVAPILGMLQGDGGGFVLLGWAGLVGICGGNSRGASGGCRWEALASPPWVARLRAAGPPGRCTGGAAAEGASGAVGPSGGGPMAPRNSWNSLGAMSLWAPETQCQYWACRRGERGASQVLSMAEVGKVWGLGEGSGEKLPCGVCFFQGSR